MAKAKVLTDHQVRAMLNHVERKRGRHPERDRVMILASVKSGLRACEIARMTWPMLTDAEGELIRVLTITNAASKGKRGGRTIHLHPDLFDALAALREIGHRSANVIVAERGDKPMNADSVVKWFGRMYKALGFDGCSSHSGRRSFGTKLARSASAHGGSLIDVQKLLGHAQMQTTMGYVDENEQAKADMIDAM